MDITITILQAIAYWILISLFLLYSTWVHFAAIMRMRALRDAGEIDRENDRVLWACGSIMFFIGITLDVLVQFFVASPVMLELPISNGKIEWLTTSRLIRWNKSRSNSWWTRNVRRPVVELGKVLLDKVDTDGLHIN